MSRIGRSPITIPAGVTVAVENGTVTVKGPLGELKQEVEKIISVKVEDNHVLLTRPNDENEVKAKHGLYRALINNMVLGVSKGFSKTLSTKGVGYRLNVQGNKLTLNIGFSHPIVMEADAGLKVEILNNTEIKVSGIDKHAVGQFASKIRDLKPVEPYHGYGIRYSDEKVIMKQGKAAGKGKK